MKFLFVLAQLGATVVRAKACSKMHFAELCGTCCYFVHYFNSKFETLFFCWGCWDYS